MNKKELRKMVREEIRRELYSILPELLKEAVGSVMVKESRKAKRKVTGAGIVREAAKPGKTEPPMDPMKLAAVLGYGDMRPGAAGEAPVPGTSHTVAGVPMDGGLLSRETDMGVAHMRDYQIDDPAAAAAAAAAAPGGVEGDVGEVEEAYEPQFANLPTLPGGVDGGAAVPASIVAALGKKSKEVLEETKFKANWRPGMKRPK